MIRDEISFAYTAVHPGTEQTDIVFFDTENDPPNLARIYSNPYEQPSVGIGKRLFVTDTNVVNQPFFTILKNSIDSCETDELIVIPSGEQNKTFDNVLQIVRKALEHGMQRSSTFIGIGGGVICDMTAFASSIFKRGAKLELVPTTLLAMVDASIGGKTGCDFDEYKNMIGTFYPASKIYIVPSCIKTLSETEYISGLGEVIKTALLYAPKLFQILETEHDSIMERSNAMLNQIIKRCVQAKSHVVEHDLMEANLRMHLNFGHTFAHALETVAGLGTFPHGNAVVWGICRALELSVHLGICEKEYLDEVISVANLYGYETAKIPKGLENAFPGVDKTEIKNKLICAMQKDKKNSEHAVRFILQRELNSTLIQEVKADDILAVL